MKKSVYTTKEAAVLLNVSQKTIQLWANSGVLNAGKTPGGHRRIRADSVQALLDEMDGETEDPLNVADGIPIGENNKGSDTINVLLVDDDNVYLKLIRTTINKWKLPINICFANDGYEALIAMGNHKPEILITDLNMPRMDGFHMIKVIRESDLLKNTEVCVVTGLIPQQMHDGGPLGESVKILSKPINFELLKSFLVKCIERVSK